MASVVSSRSKRVAEKPGIRHGEFKFSGQTAKRKYAIIPPSQNVTKKEWNSILKVWKLRHPNLLIWMKSGGKHPSRIVGEQLATSEGFAALMNEMVSANEKAEGGPKGATERTEVKTQESTFKSTLNTVNGILYNRLVSIMEGVANAADQTDSWILVVGPPNSSEVLLEAAISRSGASPLVLVVDQIDASRYSNSFASEMFEELSDAAVSLNSKASQLAHLKSDLWDPTVNRGDRCTNKHFEEMAEKHGGTIPPWNFKSRTEPEMQGHPWFSWPYREGTHYILFQTSGSRDEQLPQDPERDLNTVQDISTGKLADRACLSSLGPLGYIFMGGGRSTSEEIQRAVLNATPAVLLHNTGKITMQYAIFMSELKALLAKTERKSDSEIAALLQAAVAKYYPTVKSLPEGDRVTAPELWQTVDVFKNRPDIFSDTIAVVNPLTDSPEMALNTLSRCFASQATGAAELGVGSVQEEVVLNAWRLHAVIHKNARSQKLAADTLYVFATLFSFSTTVISIIISLGKGDRPSYDFKSMFGEMGWQTMNIACLILPAIAGLLATVMSRLRLGSKWSTLELAAAQIVKEIYGFRTRTGRYNPLMSQKAHDPNIEEEEEDVVDNAAMASRTARMNFVRAVQRIFASVTSSDMVHDALDTNIGPAFERGSRALEAHIAHCVLKVSLKEMKAEHVQPTAISYVPLLAQADGADDDDFVSPLGMEAYVSHRLQKVLLRLERRAPVLARMQITLDVVVFALATVGTMLAALQINEWIPVAVAMGTTTTSLGHYLGFQRTLEATNIGIGQLQNLATLWCGMGVVDKRMPAVRERFVKTLEQVVVAEASSRTASAGALMSAIDDEEVGEKDGGEEKNKHK